MKLLMPWCDIYDTFYGSGVKSWYIQHYYVRLVLSNDTQHDGMIGRAMKNPYTGLWRIDAIIPGRNEIEVRDFISRDDAQKEADILLIKDGWRLLEPGDPLTVLV